MHRATILALSMSATALAQQQWSLRQTATAPPPAIGVRMAYDSFRSRTVLFGGAIRYSIPSPTFGDTWLFDGVDWSLQNPATRPPSRAHHSMVSDHPNRRVILFGGIDGNGSPLNDVWEWDGTNWSTIYYSTPPPPRGWAAATSGDYGGLAIYGGYNPHSQTWYGDSWGWSRNWGWSQASPGTGPSPRAGAAMVTSLSGAILHGGRDAQRPYIAETWVSVNNGWQLLAQAGGPARDEPAMFYDRDSQQAFLTGGRSATGFGDDLWRFDGQRWIDITPATRPAQTFGSASVLDTARRAFQIYGGASDVSLTSATNQLWEFQRPFPVVNFGNRCAVVGTAPSLNVGASAVGRSSYLGVVCATPFPIGVLTLGFNDQTWSGRPLPMDLASLGLPGCQALLAPEVVFVISHGFSSTGVNTWLNVPARPSLAGIVFFVQGLVGDATRVRGVTDAARCTIL